VRSLLPVSQSSRILEDFVEGAEEAPRDVWGVGPGGRDAQNESKTNRQKTARERYWRKKKRRLSTSDARGALSSPSNQLIFPCLCYWSLLYIPFLSPPSQLIRRVNTERDIGLDPLHMSVFFLSGCRRLNRQPRRLIYLQSQAILSFPDTERVISSGSASGGGRQQSRTRR
jgi:hypothetical protein